MSPLTKSRLGGRGGQWGIYPLGRPSPISIFGKDILEFHAAPRFGHHGSDGITPNLVVFCFLVFRGRIVAAINLDQDEARRIILLLDHIEASNARLFDAI